MVLWKVVGTLRQAKPSPFTLILRLPHCLSNIICLHKYCQEAKFAFILFLFNCISQNTISGQQCPNQFFLLYCSAGLSSLTYFLQQFLILHLLYLNGLQLSTLVRKPFTTVSSRYPVLNSKRTHCKYERTNSRPRLKGCPLMTSVKL